MAPVLAEQVALDQIKPDEYVSRALPIRMGNSMPIAYGGCAIGLAVRAACETVPAGYSPYSLLGHFHGPASTQEKLHCSVQRTRDTRTFATRRVQVRQRQGDGSFRTCLELMADFQVAEVPVVDFSAPMAAAWPKPDDCAGAAAQADSLRARGVVTDAQFEEYHRAMGINMALLDLRACPNGVAGQNLMGAAKTVKTTQDGLPLTSKASAEWQRSRSKLESPAAHFAAMAFVMDAALSFVPLTHAHKWFDDVSACSTLDFALRLFVPRIDMESWTLKERFATRGSAGRTYSEGRLWDENGQMLASMTQQSIMRPKKETASKI